MKYGVVFPQTEFGNDVQAIKDYAQTAEGLGYEKLKSSSCPVCAILRSRAVQDPGVARAIVAHLGQAPAPDRPGPAPPPPDHAAATG